MAGECSGGSSARRWTMRRIHIALALTMAAGCKPSSHSFYDRVVKGLDGDIPTFSIEPKIDGFGIELTYQRGELALGATRGDGRIGEDVTANVKLVKGVPLKLREPVNIVVR